MQDFSIVVVLVLLGAMVLLWMVVRPVFAAVAVASFAFVSPTALPVLLGSGRLSFRYVDIFSGILACIVLMQLAAQRDTHGLQELGAFYVPLMPFLLYIGISLANVGFFQPHSLTASLASYLRLLATASLAPLVYLSIKDKNDLGIFHKLLICCFLISVVASAVEGRSALRVDDAQWSAARGSGSFLPVNTLGLVSGLLVVYALIKGDGKSRALYRIIFLSCGLMGLFFAKSVSSTLATAGASALYLSAMRASSGRTLRGFRWVVIGSAMMIVAALAIWTLRRGDVEGFSHIRSGSFAQRFMLAQAGLWIFLDHPFVGVGWQGSATEAFLHSPTLTAALMQKFPDLPNTYFFAGAGSTQVHNMYVHILAELGIVGFVLLAYACWRIGTAAIGLLTSLRDGSPYKVWAQFYTLGLVFLLIWWNQSSLYSGQTETYLAFIFLAALATVARLVKSERQQA